VDLRQAGVAAGIGDDQAVDVGESEDAADWCMIVLTE
jgi:hypothetical protein